MNKIGKYEDRLKMLVKKFLCSKHNQNRRYVSTEGKPCWQAD